MFRYKSMLSLMSYLGDKKYPIKFKVEAKCGGESSHVRNRLNGVCNMQKESKHTKR